MPAVFIYVEGFSRRIARIGSTMLVARALISSSGRCDVGCGTTMGWNPRIPEVSAWYLASRTKTVVITAAVGMPALSRREASSTLLNVQEPQSATAVMTTSAPVTNSSINSNGAGREKYGLRR